MMKKVGIYAERVECVTFTIAQALVFKEFNVYVLTDKKELNHSFYYEQLEKLNEVKIINDWQQTNLDFDWLFVEVLPHFSRKKLSSLRKCTNRLALILYYQQQLFHKAIIQQFKITIKYIPWIFKSPKMFFLDKFYAFDLYRIWAEKYFLGFDVHSNFLVDDNLQSAMFAFEWQPAYQRKYKFNFIGNRNPQERSYIIKLIKLALDDNLNNYLSKKDLNQQNIIWIEYGDETGEKRGIPAQEYMNYLSESDFTLCPPGYVKITHRVVEALVRGSIPILHEDELSLYDINLQNNVNCIAVSKGNWIATIQRAMSLHQSEIIEMRCNILSMKDDYLSRQAFSNRLMQKMGIEAQNTSHLREQYL